MLNDIRLHVDADEQKQREQERIFAQAINIREANNFTAFKRFIPTIAKILPAIKYQRLSMFVDKNAQTNIVNLTNGTAMYDLPVDASIQQQAENWSFFSACLNLQDSPQIVLKNSGFEGLREYSASIAQACNANIPDTLVVLGLGKGSFLPLLMQQIPAKQVVIYEPDWEIFRCSVALFDWSGFLHNAEQKGIQVFLQIGDNLGQIFDEINELHKALGSTHFVFFQHQIHEIYNQIISRLRKGKWDSSIAEVPITPNSQQVQAHISHHLRHFNCLNASNFDVITKQTLLFKANMALFEEHYPNIYEVFTDYQPQCWETIEHQINKQINVFNRQHMCFFSGEKPLEEGNRQAEHFSQYPNLDGLVFGHQGDKLKHYMHNRFVRKVDLMLTESKIDKGELPAKVKMLLIFGLGSGYMLNALYAQHDVQNLCICEPNPDFFYAALHAVDWAPIFEKVEQEEYKLYINIGEASSLLFKDLTNQFVSLGPHLLNETYIMQAYDNPLLHKVLVEVRQQLQVIFSMGENLDHVLYGIAHTAQAIKDKVPALRYNSSHMLSKQQKQIPIFIVGNGPSLDESICAIEQYKKQAIVVSCGTSLQALHRHGIRPDFHAEVEQNRANFDWAGRIGDPEYLKKISLISVNGIHPDTYALFKNAYMVFKSGESSTQAVLSMLPPKTLTSLTNAYPTVTNMVMSLFLQMGFEQIYLHGVDLGFADEEKHHSASSGYYESGKQVFEYKKIHEGVQRVKGNRQAWVYTKTEFNISRMLFEQVLADYPAECFNLSNGAFVTGTIPLLPDDVLVVNSGEDKRDVLRSFADCFTALDDNIVEKFNQAYSQKRMHLQLAKLSKLTQQAQTSEVNNKHQIDELILSLREILVDAKKEGGSLFFYYFFNSVNYLSAVLSKAIMHPQKDIWQNNCQAILQDWNRLMSDFKDLLPHQFDVLDISECHSEKHEQWVLSTSENLCQVNYLTLSEVYQKQYEANRATQAGQNKVTIVNQIEVPEQGYLIIDVLSAAEASKIVEMLLLQATELSSIDLRSIGLVFHHYELLQVIKEKCQNTVLHEICFIYLPLIWQSTDFVCSPTLKSLCENGYQDYVSRSTYFHFLQARSPDIAIFSHILYKPRFNETGAFNACNLEENAIDNLHSDRQTIECNIQYIENIDDFNQYYDEDFNFTGNNEQCDGKLIEEREFESRFLLDHTVKHIKNEFTAHSCLLLENKIIQHLNFDTHYSFKHYIALPKLHRASSENESITKLDNMQNRGLLIKRKPLAYELFGQWYLN